MTYTEMPTIEQTIKYLVDDITEELVHQKIKEEIINLDDTIKMNVKEFFNENAVTMREIFKKVLFDNETLFEKKVLSILNKQDVYNDIALLNSIQEELDTAKEDLIIIRKTIVKLRNDVRELKKEKEDYRDCSDCSDTERAGVRWSEGEDLQLKAELNCAINKIAKLHQRTPLAIVNRINKTRIKIDNLNEPYLDAGII